MKGNGIHQHEGGLNVYVKLFKNLFCGLLEPIEYLLGHLLQY